MSNAEPQLILRALILHRNRLLMISAWPHGQSDEWRPPGGPAKAGIPVAEALRRHVLRETGLTIEVAEPCLIDERHDPDTNRHVVEVFMRCRARDGLLPENWREPGSGNIGQRRYFTLADFERKRLRFRPETLPEVAWSGMGSLATSGVVLR